MTPEQQQVLFENTARAISGASKETIERHIANCTKADPAYGAGVRAAIDALNAAAAEADDVAKGAANANAPVDGAPVDRDDFADVPTPDVRREPASGPRSRGGGVFVSGALRGPRSRRWRPGAQRQ